MKSSAKTSRCKWFPAKCAFAAVALFPLTVAAAESDHSPDRSVDAGIRLNTIGYRPQSNKKATISTGGAGFIIRNTADGTEALRGRLTSIAGNGDRELRLADFSKVERPGDYQIEVIGADDRANIRISSDIYNWPLYCSVRAMYLWRCGIEVSADQGGEHFHQDACHLEDAYLDHVGGPEGKMRDGTGGWHDAGDYNKYTVNGAFTAGMMLQAWQHFQKALAPLKVDIPESGNDVPDFLDEVRWELEWLLKMQTADGRVYHKLSTLKFGGFILPHEENARRYFSPWSSAGTADFVAVMAQAARVFHRIDEDFANRCLAAAKKSYKFLQQHPDDHRPDLSAFSTGAYDAPDPDDRLWAAAELWETTGDDACLRDLEQRISALQKNGRGKSTIVDVDWDWGNVRNLGLFTYVLSQREGRDPALVEQVRNSAIAAADSIVQTAKHHSYARPLGDTYYWGCNGTVARQVMNLHVARLLLDNGDYEQTMLDCLNHVFGRNPFGRSYVTGIGERPPLFPHDRRSGGDRVKAPWPGYLVGGPWPKATDWYDTQEDYRTNEVAINWNGALIYALAAFVEPASFDKSIAAAKRPSATTSSASE